MWCQTNGKDEQYQSIHNICLKLMLKNSMQNFTPDDNYGIQVLALNIKTFFYLYMVVFNSKERAKKNLWIFPTKKYLKQLRLSPCSILDHFCLSTELHSLVSLIFLIFQLALSTWKVQTWHNSDIQGIQRCPDKLIIPVHEPAYHHWEFRPQRRLRYNSCKYLPKSCRFKTSSVNLKESVS